MLKQVARFLLCVPPLEELTDDIADVIERYRYNTISKESAMKILLEDYEAVLQNYIDQNLSLSGLS